MLYVILGHEAADSLPKRRETRPRHLAYLEALKRAPKRDESVRV